jgi:hypothetical protein
MDSSPLSEDEELERKKRITEHLTYYKEGLNANVRVNMFQLKDEEQYNSIKKYTSFLQELTSADSCFNFAPILGVEWQKGTPLIPLSWTRCLT